MTRRPRFPAPHFTHRPENIGHQGAVDEGRWTVRKRSIDRRKKPRWERREKQGHKESTRENEKVREREKRNKKI